MLTIKTTGNDAWDTDFHLLSALIDYHVVVNGKYVRVEGVSEGELLLEPLDNISNTASGPLYGINPHNIEIEVL